jgi:hypothetical protein
MLAGTDTGSAPHLMRQAELLVIRERLGEPVNSEHQLVRFSPDL